MIDEKARLQEHFIRFLSKIKCFKPCFLLLLVVLSLSIIFHFLSEFLPDVKQFLAASLSSPWGVITSIFIHENISHLISNMRVMVMFTLFFVFSNMHIDEENIKRRVPFFVAVAVFAAIFSNVLWITIRPDILTIGASGVVYSTIGITFGFSMINFTQYSINLPTIKRTWKLLPKKDRAVFFISYVVNALIFLCTLFFALLFTPEFLSKGPKVNVFVHGISFYTSLLLCVISSILMLRRR